MAVFAAFLMAIFAVFYYTAYKYSYGGQPDHEIRLEKVRQKMIKQIPAGSRLGNERFIYLGPLQYYLEGDIIEGNLKKGIALGSLLSEEITFGKKDYTPSVLSKEERDQNKKLWDYYTGGSNPPSSGVTEYPSVYESGYLYTESQYISGVPYYDQDDYGSNTCLPTAAGTVLAYWDAHGYSEILTASRTVYYLVTTLADYMGWSSQTGTPVANSDDGIEEYTNVNPLSYNFSATVETSPTWSQISGEINIGRPFIAHVYNNTFYGGNHSVAATGYIVYVYDIFTNSKYVQVHDGWSTSNPRYITFTGTGGVNAGDTTYVIPYN